MATKNKIIALILTLLVFLPINVIATVPPHTTSFFINDFANVLSETTQNYIIQRNLQLSQISNAQVVFTTVQFTGGTNEHTYALNMFNEWGIGSEYEDNGILILFITEQDHYEVILGDGMLNIIPAGDLELIFINYVEPYFNEREFDVAAMASFTKIMDQVHAHYQVNPIVASSNIAVNNSDPIANTTSDGVAFPIFSVIIIVLLVFVATSIFGGGRRRRMRGGRRGGMFGSSIFWWLMPSPFRRRQPRDGSSFGGSLGAGSGTVPRQPTQPRYKGYSTPFGGGGRSSGGGISRGGNRYGGGGRSSGGGIGRRR